MKQLIVLAVLSVALFSCGGNKKTEVSEDNKLETSIAEETGVYELDNLLDIADQKVEKTIKVVGTVTHTCKHSGKRCFIIGKSRIASMRVEAKGEIGGFNRELVGSKLEITGTLKEQRLTEEYIDQMKQDVEKKKDEGAAAAETCTAELRSINDMRKWMKDHGKNYYVIYYMDGLNYTTID
jgi:hypothetical protein